MNIDIQFEESNQSIDVDFGEIQIIGGTVVDATIEPLSIIENGTYTAQGNVDGYSPIHVNVPIPEGYIQPQGTIEITENGEYGVTEYANAIVNVEEPKEEQEKTIDITENGTTEVTPDDGKVLSKVTVNVDVEKGITPSGTLEITENGEYDVTEYASANVNVGSTAEEFVGVKYLSYAFTSHGYYLPKTADARSLDKVLTDPSETDNSNKLNAENAQCLAYMFANASRNANGAYFFILEDVYLPSKAVAFNFTFQNCINLKNIYGDLSNITSVGGQSFDYCQSLTQIPYMPNLQTISNYAFRNCTGLTEVKLPSTITSIHANGFYGCINLKDIYVPWSEGEVANAPWGATNATIHYNTTYDENHNPIV